MPLPEPRPPAPRETRPDATVRRFWLAASLLLLLFPLRYWMLQRPDGVPFVPDTPLDRVNGRWAREFRFLQQAAPRVPRSARFSVIASSPIEEMPSYMMAIGLVAHGNPVAESYFGTLRPDTVPAEYLLSVGCVPPRRGTSLRVVARLPDGCIYRSSGEGR